ncbi:MAG: D-alanyl-D-alanine carboxypeptidase/D-alanyl-D-alanine-endopeptidase [Bacteroidales bacterium]|nr:D-alanyl-D-alanine carboxypeptidase/D-alanyl-D-alanine-endopeptidase [Bacteroidales bacterium]
MKKLLSTICISVICAALSAQPLALSGGETQAAVIIDIESGETIYSYNPSTWITPASLTKLFTTAAAIEKFSPTAKIKTQAFYNESTNELTIVGHADPTFDSKNFVWHSADAFANDIAKALKNKNITHISCVNFDCGFIQGETLSPKRIWEDMGNYYGSAPQAFNIFDNTLQLTLVSPKEIGKDCTIKSITPQIIESKAITSYVKSYAKNADSVYVFGTSAENGQMYVSGAMPAGRTDFRVKAALPDPNTAFADTFLCLLTERGIKANSKKLTNNLLPSAKGSLLTTSESPSIEAIAQKTNHDSNNLFADALLLQLGGEPTSWNGSIAALRQYAKKATGSEPRFYDGSGLSPLGKATVLQFANLLIHMHKSKYQKQYEGTLAIAGQTGTLRSFGRGTRLAGKMIGKSGSMTGVVAYAGIVSGADGKQFAVCVIVNNHSETSASVKKAIANWIEKQIKL